MILKRRDRDIIISLFVIVCGFVVVVLLAMVTGCASTPCECPPIVPPEVVEVVVFSPPPSLPTPRPPALLIYGVDETDTGAVIEAIAADWHELMRAWREALAIITENNEATRPD